MTTNNTTTAVEETSVGPVFIIGVCGGTAGGKTSVCRRIIQELGDQRVSIVSMDSFYKSLPPNASPSTFNFDHPDAFDYDRFSEVLASLVKGLPTDIPVYSFEKHARLPEVENLVPTPVIIVEGILIFHDKRLRDLMHMKVFVDTDADTRLLRRIRRDIRDRGRTYESVIDQYEATVKPAHDEFIEPTKKFADIIIPHWPNEAAVDLITHQVRAKMGIPDIRRQFPNLSVMTATATTRYLHTVIRDVSTPRVDFVFHADRLIRLAAEFGTAMVPWNERTVTTSMGKQYVGVDYPTDKLCAVSIVRGGEAMEVALAQVCQNLRVGKMVFRFPNDGSGETGEPTLIYSKLPRTIKDNYVFLLDPILGCAKAVKSAVETLINKEGVLERNIIVLSLMISPEAVRSLCGSFPAIRVVTTEVDSGVDERGYLVPGIGNFADKYFGTNEK